MTGASLLLALLWPGAASAASPKGVSKSTSVPAAVHRSTAPLAPEPANIPELKRRIQLTQDDILKLRGSIKRAKKRKDAAGEEKARQDWLKAKEQLRADRETLRKAIVAQEALEAEKRKGKGLRPEPKKASP